ncbi:MAG: exodeoxyribonuclease V subunit gamma, partial [Desulfobacterales bacterium]|nr:exodeoxyribonuclease V subunit gamma [Desulfobacterales bacterium]
MPIELYFSNRLEELAGKFSELLAGESRETVDPPDPFDPPAVIVPNANLTRWLQLELARRQSIFMHVEFKYLESGLWDLLSDLDPDKNPPAMLDHDALKIFTLSALRGLDPADEEASPITRYLRSNDGAAAPDYAARLWQLSEKLAYLFQEYEYHRLDMIQGWTASDATPPSAMERCQRRIYLKVRASRDRYFRETGKRLLFLSEYAEEVMARIPAGPAPGGSRKRIHLFGLSQISPLHLEIIGRPREFYNLSIYALNPSREFWEDVRTPGELRWIKKKNARKLRIQPPEMEEGALFSRGDNALLSAWGKPGRESVRLLCGLTDYEFNACHAEDRADDSVLKRVQQNILTLSDETPPGDRLHQDRSLQIIACPGVHREVETVYNSILFNLQEDERLMLTDIAILVPDMSTYKPVFDSVFNRRPGRIAYNLVDSRADIESVYGRAALGLLALAYGRFSRKAVFDILLNPCFMARWDVGEDDVYAWAGWAEALRVFHTFQRTGPPDPGAPASGLYTWKQGLQRLRLARILTMSYTDASGRAGHVRGLTPHADFNSGNADLARQFCQVVEALDDAVNALNRTYATAAEWKTAFLRAADSLFDIPPAFRGEGGVRQNLLKSFDFLTLYERLREDESAAFMEPALIREFIQANLRSISGGYGSYLTGGVTISALLPMRPIPFQIVYVLGMAEGAFPGKADMSSLDLRKAKRRIGDISPPERDRYLFLEMLQSVGEKLYIGFVARDLQKDREIQPCGVVNQLKRYVERSILPPGEEFRFANIPLSGDAASYLEPDAVNDGSDVMVNYSLADRVTCLRNRGAWERARERAADSDLERAKRLDPDFSVDAPRARGQAPGTERIFIAALKKFLEDPIGQGVQRQLGLGEEEVETIEGLVMREDEPFFAEFPFDYRLRTAPLAQWLDASLAGPHPPPPDEIHD